MRYAHQYFQGIHQLIDQIYETQQAPMMQAVAAMAKSVADGGVVHIFGAGHTQMLGLEVWYRAGQPGFMSPIFDEGLWPFNGPLKGSELEKLPGYGDLLFRFHDARAGEVVFVLSNSGRNAAPIDVALAAKARGLSVVGITSMDYTTRVASKHESGKRLFEIADIVIDNAAPLGDATLSIEGIAPRVGPVSTILNAAILNSLLVELDARLVAMGIEPPIFTSANLDTDLSKNAEYVRRFAPWVKFYKD